MGPFTVSQTIRRPRDEVYDYLSDAANLPEFTDHFLKDWRMVQEETHGLGAGGRFRMKVFFGRFAWGDSAIVELEPPRLIVMAGRSGKYNRIKTLWVFELADNGDDSTEVTVTVESRPPLPTDKLMEIVWESRPMRRGWRRAMRRLATILEEDRERGARATISGGARKPATGLRV
jgi:uncharacterized protein YndB with AHSA1/START domain